MELSQGDRVGETGQLLELVIIFQSVVQTEQVRVLLSLQCVKVDCEKGAKFIMCRIQTEQELVELEGCPPATSTAKELDVTVNSQEEGSVLNFHKAQTHSPCSNVEETVKALFESIQCLL